MKPDLTTRRGIDAEIMSIRRTISRIEDEEKDPLVAGFIIGLFERDIRELREMREAIQKPWEKPRPIAEASLVRYGVTV